MTGPSTRRPSTPEEGASPKRFDSVGQDLLPVSGQLVDLPMFFRYLCLVHIPSTTFDYSCRLQSPVFPNSVSCRPTLSVTPPRDSVRLPPRLRIPSLKFGDPTVLFLLFPSHFPSSLLPTKEMDVFSPLSTLPTVITMITVEPTLERGSRRDSQRGSRVTSVSGVPTNRRSSMSPQDPINPPSKGKGTEKSKRTCPVPK